MEHTLIYTHGTITAMGFRFRRRTGGMRRFARRVRAVTGQTLVKRVNIDQATIPDVTSVNYDNPLALNLLECVETMDEEAESDASGIADAPLYSRIKSAKLEMTIIGSTGTGNMVRWALYKKPDGESLLTNLATQWHSSDDTPTMREIRKYVIAKGQVFVNASTATAQRRIFISRKALARISPLKEGDVVTLVIAKDAGGTTMLASLWGSIYLRANG